MTSLDRMFSIIDRATTSSIATATRRGSKIDRNSEPNSPGSKADVANFVRLFDSYNESTRRDIMYELFPMPKIYGRNVDEDQLRKWLKRVARAMNWGNENQMREMLGVRPNEEEEKEIHANKDDDHIKTNQEMDDVGQTFEPTLKGSTKDAEM